MTDQYFIVVTICFLDIETNRETMTTILADIHPNKIKRSLASKDGFTIIDFVDNTTYKVCIPFWEFVELQKRLVKIDTDYEASAKEYYKNRYNKELRDGKGED